MISFNPLEKIVFKKGVFEDVANYLVKYKNVFIITTDIPKKLYLPALAGFLNDKGIPFNHCDVNEELTDQENVLKCASKANGYDCILSLGSGKITDLAKIVAKNLNKPLIVIPSTISHFGYFSNYAYFTTAITTEKIACDYPEKIFIDENIIKSSPDHFVFSSCCFIFSFLETYFSELVKHHIFSNDNTYEINTIKRIINKTEGLLNWVYLKKEISVLNLMDNMIELFTTVDKLNCDFPAIDMAAINMEENINSNFGRRALTYSNTILTIYKFFWTDPNLSYKNIPEQEKLIKILQKNGKNSDFFDNFIKNFQNVTSAQFFFKVKTVRPSLAANIILEKEKMTKLSRRIMNIYTRNETRTINEEKFIENISLISLSSNCFHLNTLMRLGYLNFA